MNWFKKIINEFRSNINEIQNERKKSSDKELLKNINNRFYLKETSGKIYIMCEGTAVYSANDNEQASQIVDKIKEMRQTAYIQHNISKIK